MTASRRAALLALAFALCACATPTAATTNAATTSPEAASAPTNPPAPEAAPTPAVAPTPEVAPTTAAAPAAPLKPRVYWAVRMVPGPKWVAGKSANEQPGIDAHIENMQAWNERGLMYLGGPYLDSTGGMAVLRVKNAKEAKDLADADPGVLSGLLVPEIHPWLCVFRTGD